MTYFTSLGLEATITRYISEYRSQGYLDRINKLLLLSIVLRGSALILFFLTVGIYKKVIFEWMNFPQTINEFYIIIALFVFLSRFKWAFGSPLMASYGKVYISKIHDILLSLLRLILYSIVINYDLGIEGLIFAKLLLESISISFFAFMAIGIIMSNRKNDSLSLDRVEYKRISKFSIYSILEHATGVFREMLIDNFFIIHYLNTYSVGIYSFAIILVGIPRGLNPLSLMRSIINPNLVDNYYSSGKRDDILYTYFDLLIKIYFLVSVPLLIGLAFIAREMVTIIYGQKYIESLPIIYIYLGCFSIGLLQYAIDPIINVLEKKYIYVYGTAIFAGLNILLNVLLIPVYGVIGASIATGSSLALQSIFYFMIFNKVTGLNFRLPIKDILRAILNYIPYTAFLWIYSPYNSNIMSIIVGIVLAMLIYIVTLSKYKILNEDEKVALKNITGMNIRIL